MPPPMRNLRRFDRAVVAFVHRRRRPRSSGSTAPSPSSSASSAPAIVASTSSKSVLVAPTIAVRPGSTNGASDDQVRVMRLPGRHQLGGLVGIDGDDDLGVVVEVDDQADLRALVDDVLDLADDRPARRAAPPRAATMRSGRSITVTSPPGGASPTVCDVDRGAHGQVDLRGRRRSIRRSPTAGSRLADPMNPATKMLAGRS